MLIIRRPYFSLITTTSAWPNMMPFTRISNGSPPP
ncbi:hypothetical protein YPPY88_3344, partial [Yersinia pestis PY-88]